MLKCVSFSQGREVIINVAIERINGLESLFVEGSIYGHELKMLVDTGTSRTIVRPDMVNAWRVRQSQKKLVLTTATGKSM